MSGSDGALCRIDLALAWGNCAYVASSTGEAQWVVDVLGDVFANQENSDEHVIATSDDKVLSLDAFFRDACEAEVAAQVVGSSRTLDPLLFFLCSAGPAGGHVLWTACALLQCRIWLRWRAI